MANKNSSGEIEFSCDQLGASTSYVSLVENTQPSVKNYYTIQEAIDFLNLKPAVAPIPINERDIFHLYERQILDFCIEHNDFLFLYALASEDDLPLEAGRALITEPIGRYPIKFRCVLYVSGLEREGDQFLAENFGVYEFFDGTDPSEFSNIHFEGVYFSKFWRYINMNVYNQYAAGEMPDIVSQRKIIDKADILIPYQSLLRAKRLCGSMALSEQSTILDARKEQTYLNLIGALENIILSDAENLREKKEWPKNRAGLISLIATQYRDYRGLSKRNLEKKLPEAENSLKNNL